MSGIHDLSELPMEEKAEIIKWTLPIVEPNATQEQLQVTQQLADSLRGPRNSKGASITERQRVLARSFVDKKWAELQSIVNQQFDDVGGNGFRQLLGTDYLELHPFARLSPRQILEMGMENDFGVPQGWRSDETYEEYLNTVMSTVQDGRTYPLFDDLTGDIVNEGVRNGVISPSQAARARSRHGGLSGDLIQNLPLFEEAGVSEILDIRVELSEYLDSFRLAVSEFAQCIQAASWEGEFSDEAERIYREQVAPAVRNIERAIEENSYLKELLSRRSAPGAAQSTAASLATFVGSSSALWSLTVLALGLGAGGSRVLNDVRDRRQSIEGERLYFYYQAGKSLDKRGAYEL